MEAGKAGSNQTRPYPTHEDEFIVILSVCYTLCIWTVCVHGCLILFFYLNRKADWFGHCKTLIGLVVSDFFAGTCFILLLTMHIGGKRGQSSCVIISGFYMVSQCFINLQLLRLCVCRLVSVFKGHKITEPRTSVFLIHMLSIFILGSTLCIPFVLLVVPDDVEADCSLESMVGYNTRSVCIYWIALILLPNSLTISIYTVIALILRHHTKKINPLRSSATGSRETEKICRTDNNPEVCQNNGCGQHRCKNAIVTTRHYPSGNDRGGLNGGGAAESDRLYFTYLPHYKDACVTIGMIILLSFLSVLPHSGVLLYYVINGYGPHTMYWMISIFCLQTNSVVSPFVYVFRVNRIKTAFKRTVSILTGNETRWCC